MRLSTIAAAAAALLVAGCFDVAGKAQFKPDGSAAVEVDLAISMQFAALVAGLAKDGGGDPLKDCVDAGPRQSEIPAGVSEVKFTRGTRGESMTCTVSFNAKDPVELLKDVRPKPPDDKDPVEIKAFSFSRRDERAYAFRSEIAALPKAEKPKDGAEEFGANIAMAMMANRFLTLTLSGERIENANGDVSADGKSVTWKVPLMILMKPPPGYRQEFRADVVYKESGFLDRILQLFR